MAERTDENGSDGFVVVEDFDSVEPTHSTPRWEVKEFGSDRIAVKEIDPVTENAQAHYIPKSVFSYVSVQRRHGDME